MRHPHSMLLQTIVAALILTSGFCFRLDAAPPTVGTGRMVEGFNSDNNTPATALPLVLDGNKFVKMSANLYPNGDTDYFSFTGAAGDRVYAAVMTSNSAGSSTDSQLTVLGTDGTTTLEFDDDNGTFAALSSTIAGVTLPSSGTYFIKVNDFTAGTTSMRGYDLYVQVRSGSPTPEAEPNDTEGTANSGSFWISGARAPAAATEQDWHTITLNAGDTVFLSLDLDPERDAATWNGRLGFGQFGDTNNQTLVVDDAGTGDVSPNPTLPSEAMFVTVKNAGTYYAFVDSASAAVGGATATYHLNISVLPAAGGTYTSYASTDVPKTLGPSNGLTSSTITIPGHPHIEDIDVEVRLNHTVMQELDVSLRSPADNNIGLFTDIGAAATGGQQQMDVIFDDDAGIPPAFTVLKGLRLKPENNSTAGTASTSGAFRLRSFYGEDAGGTWTLDVRDDTNNANGGSLEGWSLRIREREAFAPVGLTPVVVFSTDFESGDAGFTHEGVQDEWELGTPATVATTTANPIATFNTAHSGVNCWKTDLDGPYNASSNQELTSPIIDLTAFPGMPVVVSWAMRHQMETANFDHMYVEVEDVDNGTKLRLYEWLDPTPISASAGTGNPQVNIGGSYGWGVHTVRADSMAGKRVKVRFHVDSDSSVQFGGLAVDDVSVTAYRQMLTTVLDSTPPAISNSSSATFTVSATGGTPLRYEVSLDMGPYSTVPSTFTLSGLAEGPHSAAIRAVDQNGTPQDASSYSWVVDTLAPSVTLTQTPSLLTNQSSATFQFTADDGTGTGVKLIQASLDNGAYNLVTSPYSLTDLSEGQHKVAVRAEDMAGNVTTPPATYLWTVDTIAPPAPVISAPANAATVSTARPEISGQAEPQATVRVYVDATLVASPTADATGGWSYTPGNDLAETSHQVYATATDAAGNASPASATTTFTVQLGTAEPTAGAVPPPPGPGGYVVSRQTGLFNVDIPVTNTTAAAINGFRLYVDISVHLAQFPSLRLYNSSSAPGVSPAYIDYPYPVAKNETIQVHLEFYTSTRTFPNPFTPVISAVHLNASDVGGLEGAGVQPTLRVQGPGRILLEWPAVAGLWYRVQYSDTMAPNSWFYSPVPLQAGGSRMQWLDNGAPLTRTAPGSSRFYRVNEVPAPPSPP